MNITVLGAGMGLAAAHALKKLGHAVLLIDKDVDVLDRANKQLDKVEGEHAVAKDIAINFEHDCILSCLPYFKNLEIAKVCIDNGVRYCDLGGSVEVQNEIEAYAQKATKPLALSLGLAPGLINIVAESLIAQHGVPEELNMYVGGLPNPAIIREGYRRTWSVDGLYNEYVAPCEALVEGEIVTEDGMSGIHNVGEYDAFMTSGGISNSLKSFKEHGIVHAKYFTLRNPGHYSEVKSLLGGGLTPDQVKAAFTKLYPWTKDDMVVTAIMMYYQNVQINYSKIYFSDPEFSAMQKCTGFSAASVVDLVAKGTFDFTHDQILKTRLVEYQDITPDFFLNLTKLGL